MTSKTDTAALKAIRRREMECAVCLNRLSQPKGLSCFHNFCHHCLETLVQDQKIVCPVCKKVTTLEAGGVDDLPKNTTMLNILETLCESCLGKDREVRCDHCGLWFCVQCHQSCKQQQVLTGNGKDLLKELKEREEQIKDKITGLAVNVETVRNHIDNHVRDMMNAIQLSAKHLKDELEQEEKQQSGVLNKCLKTVSDLQKTISEKIDENNLKYEDIKEKYVEDITSQWSSSLVNYSAEISKAHKLISFIAGRATATSVGELAKKPSYEHSQIENSILGSNGSKSGQFSWPTGVAVSPVTNNLIVLDNKNNRVQLFNDCHEFISQFGSKGNEKGQFDFGGYVCGPGLAVTDDGLIVVGDASNHRLQLFMENGEHIRSIGSLGSGAGQFNYPFGLHVHKNLIYVCDSMNYRVQVFDEVGSLVRQFGTRELFDPLIPMDVTVCQNKDVVVAAAHPQHPDDGKLFVFDLDGTHKRTITDARNASSSINLHMPYSVTTDNSDYIIVSDYHTHNIHILTASGKLLRTLAKQGHRPGELDGPSGVACTQKGDIAVADCQNNRIQIFSLK